MKRTRIVIITILVCFLLLSLVCTLSLTQKKYKPSDFNGKITQRASAQLAEDETDPQDGLHVVITNLSGERFVGTRVFELEVLKNEFWYKVPYAVNDPRFQEDGYTIDPFSSATIFIPVTVYYGRLSPGTFRILTQASGTYNSNNDYLIIEFTVP